MLAIIVIILCAAAYVIHSTRKDRRVVREHEAITTALLPGPRIRELTAVRPNPKTRSRLASGSQPAFTPMDPDSFRHVPTDYGTYTSADVGTAILGRADTEPHHTLPACAEAPSHDTLFGDGGGHHGH